MSIHTAAEDDDYRMQHRPSDADYGAPLHDLESMMPDFYAHPEYYHHGTTGEHESTRAALKARGNPEAKVRIYRALPAEHAHQGFRPGDWVSTSHEYAREHARQNDDPKDDWPVIRATVPAKHLHTSGDLTEYGYNGEKTLGGMIAHKGGHNQEVRMHADGVIRPVQRRQGLNDAARFNRLWQDVAYDSRSDARRVDGTQAEPASVEIPQVQREAILAPVRQRRSSHGGPRLSGVAVQAEPGVPSRSGVGRGRQDPGFGGASRELDQDSVGSQLHGVFRAGVGRGGFGSVLARDECSASTADSPRDGGRDRGAPTGLGYVGRLLPNQRVFGPTYGLDRRLWEPDGQLKGDVRVFLLRTVGQFFSRHFGPDWQQWARIYFAGSEASMWTGPDLIGNSDFDTLIGIDYQKMRKAVPELAHLTSGRITAMLNDLLRSELRDPAEMITVDGEVTGPWDATFYVNPDSWDIRRIRPYAAYDVGADVWAVKPPDLPDWSLDKFPPAVIKALKGAETYARDVLKLPEPQRTQQGAALFDAWHSDRSRAFSDRGQGWWDFGNLREKFLDQTGIWVKLVDCKHRDDQGLGAPLPDWSTGQPFGLTASLATDAADEIGRREHPHVEQYRSGGMGHQEGDESRSVVGFMPVHQMQRFREHAGDWHPDSDEVVGKIRQGIRDGVGIRTPLMVQYSHKDKWGYLGEGNHRLRAAAEEGLKTVPVRVVRDSDLSRRKEQGVGAPMHLQTPFGRAGDNYVPSDIHPYHFLQESKQAVTDRWPPYLTERPDEHGYPTPVNESRRNPRGPVMTEPDAQAAGYIGPYFHGTTRRRAQDIRRGGFRQPRMHNWEMADAGSAEEVNLGHTHRTFFAREHGDALHFAQSHHGDEADVVKAYLHPDHLTEGEGGGWMPSVQVKDVAHAVAIREPKTAASDRLNRAWGSHDPSTLFGDAPTAPTPWPNAGRSKSRRDYDPDLVKDAIANPEHHHMQEIDPRELRSTQPAITRGGVQHYLSDHYDRTGETFADHENPGNRRPVVYRREDGQNLLLSGHHRATAALLQGRPLQAVVVHGPWGPDRKTAALADEDVEEAEPEEFAHNFQAAIADSPYRHHVTFHDADDIRSNHMTPLTSHGGKAGVLIHDHGDGRVEATGLYNRSETHGAGLDLLKHAVAKHGVNYGEAYGPLLPKMYETVGLETTERHPFDKEQAHPDWDYAQFQTPDYHIMHLKGRTKMAQYQPGSTWDDWDTESWDDPEWLAGLRADMEAKLLAEHGPEWMADYAPHADAHWQAALAQLGAL